jgi:hypothetical protein
VDKEPLWAWGDSLPFYVSLGHYVKDGRPCLVCVAQERGRPCGIEWVITIERWLSERRSGKLVLTGGFAYV